MKRELEKWQFVFDISETWDMGYPGWYRIAFGLLKFVEFPPEGAKVQTKHYSGLLIRFRFWVPFAKD
jgi:hypothetical protein